MQKTKIREGLDALHWQNNTVVNSVGAPHCLPNHHMLDLAVSPINPPGATPPCSNVRLLLWAHTAHQTVPEEDVGGLHRWLLQYHGGRLLVVISPGTAPMAHLPETGAWRHDATNFTLWQQGCMFPIFFIITLLVNAALLCCSMYIASISSFLFSGPPGYPAATLLLPCYCCCCYPATAAAAAATLLTCCC